MSEAAHPRSDGGLFGERLATRGRSLAPAARRVVEFIGRNRAMALASSAMDIAASTGTSDATVVRAVQALGFAGLGELKQALVAEVGQPSTPADDMRRTLAEVGSSTNRAIDLVMKAHEEALATLRSFEAKRQLVASVSALLSRERIAVFGIGPSASLAGYVSVLLGRSGRRTLTLNATGIMLADQMLDLRPSDGLLALAYGRPYREVVAVLTEARTLGLPVVLVTDSLDGTLVRFADVVLATPRGRAERVALHGATLVMLESLILGLAAAAGDDALSTLHRLNDLRKAISGQPNDVGESR